MNAWLDDLRNAVAFLTRLPMPHPHGASPPDFVRAQRMFPLVGAAIGVGDLGRVRWIAVVELVLAGGGLCVSVASLAGMYRRVVAREAIS